MNPPATPPHPDPEPRWVILEQALREHRTVRARYHGHERLLCPHALGWKHGRPKALVYQAAGTTSEGTLPDDPARRWRSLFIDEIEALAITNDPWHTAENYTPHSTGIDTLAIALP